MSETKPDKTAFTKDEWDFIWEVFQSRNTNPIARPKDDFSRSIRDKVSIQTDFLKTEKMRLRLWHIVNERGPVVCAVNGCDNQPQYNNDGPFDDEFPYRETCSRKCKRQVESDRFFSRAKELYGDRFDYSGTLYRGMQSSVDIRCKKHDLIFRQKAQNHISAYRPYSCPECKKESFSSNYTYSKEDWIKRFYSVHGDRYGYENLPEVINGAREKVTIVCREHGPFEMDPFCHASGQGCLKCVQSQERSSIERKVAEWLDTLSVPYHTGDRELLQGKEIDIMVASPVPLGIEVNGVYFHSDRFRGPMYHKEKTEAAYSQGVPLLQVYDLDVVYRWDIVKSMIKSRLGLSAKIPARLCKVVEIDQPTAKRFFDRAHIQGGIYSKVNIALELDGHIVSVMSFSAPRMNSDHQYELTRFASSPGTTVVGGASKLFSYFVKNYGPKSILSYADRRYGTGEVYSKLGFSFSGQTSPGYHYWKFGPRLESRMKYQKHKLRNMESFDETLSEREIMRKEGYHRIYDCGHNIWTWEV